MVYSVAELPHRYFNNACPDGARAGEHAIVKGGILFHTKSMPAAKIHTDITPATVLINNRNERWNTVSLSTAVPDTYAKVRLDAYYSTSVFGDLSKMVAWLLSQLQRLCEESATATEERQPSVSLIHTYRSDVLTLLGLDWHDKVAHTRLTEQWHALREEWYLDETRVELLRAVAMRKAAESKARAGVEWLANFAREFSEQTDKQMLARVASFDVSANDIVSKIADVRRAGFDALVPPNLPAMYRAIMRYERRAKVHRVHHKFKQWRSSRRAEFSVTELPTWMRDEYHAYTEAVGKETRRKYAKLEAQEVLNCATELSSEDPVKRSEAAHWLLYRGTRIPTAARLKMLRMTNEQLAKIYNEAIDAKNAQAKEREAAEMEARVVAQCAEIDASVERYRNTPRAWGANITPPWSATTEQKARIEECARIAREAIAARKLVVTPEQDFLNGGPAPGPGDWMRVVDGNVRTTRGVNVPLRAALKALRYADEHPGEFTCSIGVDAFTMTGRDADGWITVGCHQFSPAAIELFRSIVQEQETVCA